MPTPCSRAMVRVLLPAARAARIVWTLAASAAWTPPPPPCRYLTVDEQGIGIAFERAGDDADPMNKPPAKTNVERTPAGLQMILPGCERRTLPKSTSRVDEGGQGLLHFYQPPSLREQLETRSELPLRSNEGQRARSMSGLFGS